MKIAYRILVFFFLSSQLYTAAYADSVHDNVQKLMRGEQFKDALNLIEKQLKNKIDIELLLLKGVIFAETGETEKSKDIFKKLIGLQPELPEPYNNLAVVYAENGDYSEAEFLIKKAIHTNSSYAIAQKNLTEIYAREASRAYSKALEMKQDNDSASSKKLILINEFYSLKKNKNKIARLDKENLKKNTGKLQLVSQINKKIELPNNLLIGKTNRGKLSSDNALEEKNKITKKGILLNKGGINPKTRERDNKKSAMILKGSVKLPENMNSKAKEEQKLIIETIKGWAQSWSSQNVGQYLSYYSRSFSPSGLSRAAWEKDRILRLGKPRFIRIEIDNIQILSIDNKKAKVKFTQEYESNTYKDKIKKILSLEKNQNYWWIIGEKKSDK